LLKRVTLGLSLLRVALKLVCECRQGFCGPFTRSDDRASSDGLGLSLSARLTLFVFVENRLNSSITELEYALEREL
jgi:hypothetical protein